MKGKLTSTAISNGRKMSKQESKEAKIFSQNSSPYQIPPQSWYFANVTVRDDHFKTKRHKKRLKQMSGPAPHTQLDAELAAGMGNAG